MKECYRCGFNDEDYGCTCSPSDRWYACPIENKKPENIQELKDYADFLQKQEYEQKVRIKVMSKTEILNIVNEPSKHIQIVKIDGKDSIVYSSKFVELLELIPTMLTKADMIAILEELMVGIVDHIMPSNHTDSYDDGWSEGAEWCVDYIQEKINELKAESEDESYADEDRCFELRNTDTDRNNEWKSSKEIRHLLEKIGYQD